MSEELFPDDLSPLQKRFLLAYMEDCTVTGACAACGITNHAVMKWKEKNEVFKIAFEEVREITYEKLEDAAMRRAKDGFMRPVYQGGTKVGEEQVFSDRLAEVLLKGNIPDRYKDRMHTELTGAGGGDIFALLAEGRQRVIDDKKRAELSAAPVEVATQELAGELGNDSSETQS